MSDDMLQLAIEAEDPELDGCLLDAFSEDDGFCFAKLEAIGWRMMHARPSERLITWLGLPRPDLQRRHPHCLNASGIEFIGENGGGPSVRLQEGYTI